MVGTFLKPSCGRRTQPIHSIPYSVAQPLERGSNNYYSIIQGEPRDIQRSVDQQNDHARGTYQTKYIRVLGHAEVTVSVRIKVRDDETLSEQDIYARAGKKFGGIMAFVGNGGMDKLIGVEGEGETISADEAPVFDDYMEE